MEGSFREMKNIRIDLMFDGTAYHGFQRQKNAITVQECLEKAILNVTGTFSPITGCSRTDAGVHAMNYTANFRSETKIPRDRLPLALNQSLADDIRVLAAMDVQDDFNARKSALHKTYVYKIRTYRIQNVFWRGYSWHRPNLKHPEKMVDAAKYFLGRQDFRSFMAAGSPVLSTVREIRKIEVIVSDNEIDIEVCADGFLYNMVRIIAGTLVYVGEGKIAPDEIPDIIQSGDRRRAGITAPPQGLFLKNIVYGRCENG